MICTLHIIAETSMTLCNGRHWLPELPSKYEGYLPQPVDKAQFFVLGCSDLLFAVDHKPLLKVFGECSLKEITIARLLNLKEKPLRYRFRMVHFPGVQHKVAVALSLHPSGPTEPALLVLPDDIAATSNLVAPLLLYTPPSHQFLTSIRCHKPLAGNNSPTIDDQLSYALHMPWVPRPSYRSGSNWPQATRTSQLTSIVEVDFPNFRHKLPPALQEYYQFCDQLYTCDSIILYKDHIVIPPSLWQHVLTVQHSAHQGMTLMTAHAESTVFLPCITPVISSLRATCNQCNCMAPSKPSALPYPIIPPVYPPRLCSLQRGKLPCCCGQILQLAHYRTWPGGLQWPDRVSVVYFCHIWHPNECATWWCHGYTAVPKGEGRASPIVLCHLPTLQLSSGSWSPINMIWSCPKSSTWW